MLVRGLHSQRSNLAPTLPDDYVAPLAPAEGRGWEGPLNAKPWHFRVTAVIPHLETPEILPVCIELLRLQTIKPYILVIDTGSGQGTREWLETLRAPDLEIHYIRAHAWSHGSEPVTAAMDLAMTLCRTEYMYCTHADCYLRRRDYVEELLGLCGADAPAVGYRMSPREWITNEWEFCLGHAATMLYIPTLQRIGASWSLSRARRMGAGDGKDGWPDTETGLGLCLRAAGIAPVFVGQEENYTRQVTRDIDHFRSYTGAKTLQNKYFETALTWMEAAMQEAKARIAEWKALP